METVEATNESVDFYLEKQKNSHSSIDNISNIADSLEILHCLPKILKPIFFKGTMILLSTSLKGEKKSTFFTKFYDLHSFSTIPVKQCLRVTRLQTHFLNQSKQTDPPNHRRKRGRILLFLYIVIYIFPFNEARHYNFLFTHSIVQI